jgi:hypothetical protein
MTGRPAVTAFAASLFAVAAAAAQLPNYDVLATAPVVAPSAPAAVHSALTAGSAARVQWDDRFGVPNVVWAAAKPRVAASSATSPRLDAGVEAIARQYVEDYSALYGMTSADIADAYVANVHDIGQGPIVVKLRQKLGGVPVFREELNVVLDRNRDLVALTGHISALPRTSRIAALSTKPAGFLLSAASAIRSATDDATTAESIDINSFRFLGNAEGGYQLYQGEAPDPVRVRQVYFHLPDHYEPAYYLELSVNGSASTSNDFYGYVISAIDGRVLFRNNLTADDAAPSSFSYRVWASPSGDHAPLSGPQGYDGTPNPTGALDGYQPTFVAPGLITLPYGPISTKDPWLSNDATETVGNNVDAYVDTGAPDGYNGGADFRAATNGSLMFDRVYDVAKMPTVSQEQQMAAITQLFYDINFLHDWFYDAGFNEAAGNAQVNNYGRGGIGNDSIRGEAQDYSGRNNANMFTPSDGARPRMQMYLWDSSGNRTLRVDSPSSLARSYVTGFAQFGPSGFDVSGPVVATTPADGCTAITTSLAGKIAFIDRGGPSNCTFSSKATNAKAAGAIAVIVGNITTSASPDSTVTMACGTSGACTITELSLPPTMLVNLSDANAFRAALASGLQVYMHRDPSVDRDGTIDNQIVAHEWMHYMSNRLVADSTGLVNQQARGMGEGWSDFAALLLTTRPDDTRFASNATFGGVYATAVYVTTGGSNGPILNNGTYYGIRRVPYSTDLSKDPLTLKHVMNGNPITGAPVRTNGDGTNNAEVHATGEVWCSMLWEAYAALLRDTVGTSPRLTFAQAQQRMKEYLVASLKITPPSPTILEARDAVLAAAFARDKTDYQVFWQAFAKRGAGFDAVSAERFSSVNAGVVEDFNGSGGMAVTNVKIDDNVTSCLKNGILDAGETGSAKITLKNIGGVRLQATTISVVSSDASLTFASGGTVSVPATNPGDTVVIALNATLANAAAIVKPDLTITINDPQITTAGGMKNTYQARLNALDLPKDSATDDVEAASTPWATDSGSSRWSRMEVSPREHRWFAPEPWDAIDVSLVSPPLMVGQGNFSFSFKHRYAFDYAVSGGALAIDGGVIEISTDDGRTWTDIGDKIDRSTNGYGSVAIWRGNGSNIEGRRAFIATSPNFKYDLPSSSPFTTTIVNLGTDYVGKRVQVRFRFVTGSDHSTAPRLGWEIDDITFTNIQNLPFASLAPDRGLCGVSATTTTLTASVASVTNGQPITFTAAVNSSAAPSGTVDFFDNGAILATSRVENGAAKLTIGSLTAGTHTITAAFNGGKYFNPSASPAVSVQVSTAGRHRAVGK